MSEQTGSIARYPGVWEFLENLVAFLSPGVIMQSGHTGQDLPLRERGHASAALFCALEPKDDVQ